MLSKRCPPVRDTETVERSRALVAVQEVRVLNPGTGNKFFLIYPFTNRFFSLIVSDNRGPIHLGMTDVNGKHHLPYGIKKVDLVVESNQRRKKNRTSRAMSSAVFYNY